MITLCLILTMLLTHTHLLALSSEQDTLEVFPGHLNILRPLQLRPTDSDEGNGAFRLSIDCSEDVSRYFEFTRPANFICSSEQIYANTTELQIALSALTANISSAAQLENCWMDYTVKANDTGAIIRLVRQRFKLAAAIPVEILAKIVTVDCPIGEFPKTEILSISPLYMTGVTEGDISILFVDEKVGELVMANMTGNTLILSSRSKLECYKTSQIGLIVSDKRTNLISANVTVDILYQPSKEVYNQKLQFAHSMIILGLLILSGVLVWCLNFMYKRMRSNTNLTDQAGRLKPYGDQNGTLSTRDTRVHQNIHEWNKQIIEEQRGRMAIGENISVISDYEANRFDIDDFGELDFEHLKQSPVSAKEMSLDFDPDLNPHTLFRK